MKRLINAKLTSALMTFAMVAVVVAVPFGKLSADCGVPINEDTFPDPVFRDYVRAKFNQDDDEDFLSADEISQAKVVTYEDMDEYYSDGTTGDILSFQGIENLTALEGFACQGELDELDLSSNTALVSLGVYNAKLSSLDLSANTKLTTLNMWGNSLKKLDLGFAPDLTHVACPDNELEELDISACTKLQYLSCSENKLSSIDLSKNTELSQFWAQENQLTTIDVSNNKSLVELSVSDNKLTSLDVSMCDQLELLYCDSNKLTSLDITKNEGLTNLNIYGNPLTAIDISYCPNIVETYLSGDRSVFDDGYVKYEIEWDFIDYKFILNEDVKIVCDKPLVKLITPPQALDLVATGKAQALISAGVAEGGTLKYAVGTSATKAPYRDKDWSENVPMGTDAKTYYVWYRADADNDHTNIDPVCLTVKIAKPSATPTPKVTIKLNKTSSNVICGKTVKLKATVENSKNAVKWTSSNTKIASVDSKGNVKGRMAGSAIITATVAGKTAKCKIQVLYKDVTNKSEFWFTPTNDLTNRGIVKGYDNQTLFKPGNDCTRAQMVTFLYRLKGEPEVGDTENPFKDVAKDKYYYKAVLWASSKGITTGYKGGLFKPNGVCTRAQTVTFLWRMAGSPKPGTSKNPFKDVKKTDYFYKPVLWASGKKIVAGYSNGTFKPQGKCLRRQMVTFLYKYDKFVTNAK